MKLRVLAAAGILMLLLLTLLRAQSAGQQYIVILRNGEAVTPLNQLFGTEVVQHVPHSSVYLIQSGGTDLGDTLLAQLKSDSNVELVEKNRNVKLRSDSQAPLSTELVQQMASLLDGQTLTTFFGTNVLKAYVEQPALQLTHVNETRSLSTGAATRVAYIDTGVDFDHPALRPWLDPGVDLTGGQSASELDGLDQQMASLLDQQMASLLDQQMTSLLDKRFLFVLDQAMVSLLDSDNAGSTFPPEFGHGTLVAGIIHTVAPEARIVPIKAFDAYGNTSLYTLINAVYEARDLGVDVLNMSFSTGADSDVFRKAIADAQAAGVAVVASAGNDARDADSSFPAAFSNVTGVGATDFNDRLASFSNYGKAVSVTAPGAFVVSTVPGGRYAAAWGTSFSAPMVAGEMALVASTGPRGRSVSLMVVNTADSIDILNPGFERKLGKGRINALQALRPR